MSPTILLLLAALAPAARAADKPIVIGPRDLVCMTEQVIDRDLSSTSPIYVSFANEINRRASDDRVAFAQTDRMPFRFHPSDNHCASAWPRDVVVTITLVAKRGEDRTTLTIVARRGGREIHRDTIVHDPLSAVPIVLVDAPAPGSTFDLWKYQVVSAAIADLTLAAGRFYARLRIKPGR